MDWSEGFGVQRGDGRTCKGDAPDPALLLSEGLEPLRV